MRKLELEDHELQFVISAVKVAPIQGQVAKECAILLDKLETAYNTLVAVPDDKSEGS